MTAVVLLSAGRHPVSGRPAPVPAEIEAARLAGMIDDAVIGLHAGPDAAAVSDHLGLGLARIVHVVIPAEADPLPALAAWLEEHPASAVLAGARGLGGEDSGLLPYRLAHRLGLPIVADLAAIAREAGGLRIDQALPRGRRRRTTLAGPFVGTVRAEAASRIHAAGLSRRGTMETVASAAPAPAFAAIEERPRRARPRLIAGGVETRTAGGRLLVDPDPAEAATAILAHLRGLGLIAPAGGGA